MSQHHSTRSEPSSGLSRRQLLEWGAAGTVAAALGNRPGFAQGAKPTRPNFLYLITDQQGLDALSAAGCAHLRTPNLDRLAARGVTFLESHSTNPVCSPARSSIFTGRLATETGVIQNGLPIRDSVPNLGQWLGQAGYETVYVGKWHIPQSYTRFIPGFRVLPVGNNGHGTLDDRSVSRTCEAYLRTRRSHDPFVLVASFLQPHDICQWTSMHKTAPDELPYPELKDELPPLPPNFQFDPHEPASVANQRKHQRTDWSELQWRYYLWSYYRMVEEVDAEVGRVVQALEDAGLADNTLIVFTSDHGEGRARHQMIVKNYLYEEALKVPLIFSCPGRLPEGVKDRTHLVSGADIMATVCDFAGVKPPARLTGGNLRPLLEGRFVHWREFVLAEVKLTTPTPGYALRTPDFKYIVHQGDPVEQLFDMRTDPGETKNLAPDSRHADTLRTHQQLLRQRRASLDLAPNAPRLG